MTEKAKQNPETGTATSETKNKINEFRKTIADQIEKGKDFAIRSLFGEKIANKNLENSTTTPHESQTKLKEKINNMSDAEILQLIEQIRKVPIKELRGNERNLIPQAENETPETRILNIKQETEKLLAIYTEKNSDNLFTLNYSKIDPAHEYAIGLGDILKDPAITTIEFFDSNDAQNQFPILATRGKTPQGRPCFLHNGAYLKSFSGDKFRIVGSENSPAEETIQKLNQETTGRKAAQEYEKATAQSYNGRIVSVESENDAIQKLSTGKLTPSHNKEGIINKLNGYRNEKDGEEIYNFMAEWCQKFNIPIGYMTELINVESGWNPTVVNDSSGAAGLCQFIPSTQGDYNRIHIPKYLTKYPELQNQLKLKAGSSGGFTEYDFTDPKTAIIAGLIYQTNSTNELSTLMQNQSEFKKSYLLYMAHHEGSHGARKLMALVEDLEENGCHTFEQMIDELQTNRAKYSRHEGLLQKRAKDLSYELGQRKLGNLLGTHFFALRIAGRSLAANPEGLKQIQVEMEKRKSETSAQQELDGANFNTTDREKKNPRGNFNAPYRFIENSPNIYSSGAPGFESGPKKADFNLSMAVSQIKALSSKGIKTIISLAEQKNIKQAIAQSGTNINHAPLICDRDNLENNKKLFKYVAVLINSGSSFLVHCAHNAHRAPTALCGGLIESGKTKSLDDACKLADVDLNKFKAPVAPNGKYMIAQLVKFSREKNIPEENGLKPGEKGKYSQWLQSQGLEV